MAILREHFTHLTYVRRFRRDNTQPDPDPFFDCHVQCHGPGDEDYGFGLYFDPESAFETSLYFRCCKSVCRLLMKHQRS